MKRKKSIFTEKSYQKYLRDSEKNRKIAGGMPAIEPEKNFFDKMMDVKVPKEVTDMIREL